MSTQGQYGRGVRLEGARVTGLVAAVPARCIENSHFVARFGESAVADVVKMIGVKTRYWSEPVVTTADLCVRAAESLLGRLNWDVSSIGAIVFVTQTPDYRLPATACTLQSRLGLPTSCAAFDVNLGCSGYPYGLWIAMGLALSSGLERVLLLVGDTISKTVDPADRSTAMLFGDAGTATAIEISQGDWFAQFVLGSDGAGARNLMIPTGGFRPWADDDPRLAGKDPRALFMDGGEVFNFTLRAVPGLVQQALAQAGIAAQDVQAYVLHQANLFMLNHLARKLKVPADRFPINIDRFGNTSCASIPLLFVSDMRDALLTRRVMVALAGFGVGYSWASAVLPVGPLECVELISV